MSHAIVKNLDDEFGEFNQDIINYKFVAHKRFKRSKKKGSNIYCNIYRCMYNAQQESFDQLVA